MLEVDIRELLDPQRVGMDQRKEEMGIFTSKGYVFENALSYQDIYDGIHLPDIDGVAGGNFFSSPGRISISRRTGNLVGTSNYRFGVSVGAEQIKRENF